MIKKYPFKTLFFLCLLIFALVLSSCGRTTSNGLMDGASPATSALEFFYFDGDTLRSSLLFERELIEEILEKLDSVPASRASDWSLEDITLPLYGFQIGGQDGWGLYVAWSNGYWITGDGNAYTFDFDFEVLNDYPWEHIRNFPSFSSFPNARFLTKDESGWNSILLTPAELASEPMEFVDLDIILPPPRGDKDEMFDEEMTFLDAPEIPSTCIVDLSMTLVDSNRERVTVIISNDRSGEWMYGKHFSLHVLLNGEWFDVPPLPGWAVVDIGLIVPANGEVEHIYHLDMFGDLPSGRYRIMAYGLYVEFDL